jgi:DNA polymerase-3 subunit epsilon
MSRQVVLDTETTGLDPALGHRIIEIACVEMVNRRLTKNNFCKRVNPERDIDPGATAVHGITLDDLLHEPKFAEIAEDLLSYIAGAELIIHNAPFDVGFLNAELRRMKKSPISELCTITDTLAMARDLHPGKRNNLDALCDRYEVDNSARSVHGALLDAELLSDVYIAMTRGQDSLAIGMEVGVGALKATAVMAARPINLKVLRADSDELARHDEHIIAIGRACGGEALWTSMYPKDGTSE